jgi:hypothetical protein
VNDQRAMPETDHLAPAITARFQALHRLVGNTPLLAVDVRYRGEPRRIYAKHESLSLTGSVKDRMALFVLEDAYQAGLIRPGDASPRPPAATPASRSPRWAARSVIRSASSCRTG